MSERRFKNQISDVLTEQLPDAAGGTLERWLAPTTESRIEQIPVEQIHDRGWRAEVDTTEPAYRGLKASIRASGVLQPLLLRPRVEGGFEVVSGARRLRAARDTAQSTVPAVVRELDDVQALVGGSWDAVLRTGLTPGESRDLVGRLVEAGMAEAEAIRLVATAPVREGAEEELAAPSVAAAVAVAEAPVAEAVVAEAAVAEPEAAVAEAEAGVADAEAAVAEAEGAVAEAEAAVAEPEPAVAEPEALVAEPEVVEPQAEAAVAEPEVSEPVAEAEVAEIAEPDTAEAAVDFDHEIAGWPAPDEAPAATAPTEPPVPLPIDPVTFPVEAVDVNGAAPADVVEEAPTAEAEAATAEPEAAVTAEPEAQAPAEAPAAEVVAPAPGEAPAAPAPRVIPIKLPEPAGATSVDDDVAAADSMPVAAPTAADQAAQSLGSRLVSDPVPAVRMASSTPRVSTPSPLPAVLRRGPLFYAVLGIGLAVGAIVFILVTVLEGVGSGTAPIIAAVVVAVIGFVTAMVSLAQPRRLR